MHTSCALLICGLFVSCIFVAQCDFRLTPRIIGGRKAEIAQFKWQVALLYESKFFCGGTIISSTKIVTAAHCVLRMGDATEPLQVRVGSKEWKSGGKLMNVSHLVLHPNYNEPTLLNNDVAVIILNETLTFGPTIGSAALADSDLELPANTLVNISGFGTTSLSTNNPSDVLYYVTLPIVSAPECKAAYKSYPGFAKFTDNMICAGYFGKEEIKKDSCGGDSGGPLIYNSSTFNPILYGIISWGYECADPYFPGVFAKVSVYRDWINSIT